MARDFYDILGVSRTASADDIKKSYRKLAMQYHPDQNQGNADAEARFKEITQAYDVLKDDQKRAAYDRYGHEAFTHGMGGGRPGGGAGAQGFDFTGFADIFDDLFGDFAGARRGGGGTSASRGADLRYNLTVSLSDAFKGKQETIRVTTSGSCDTCAGSGSEAGSQPAPCTVCKGKGSVRAQQGFFTVERTCATCQGAGKIIKDPCRKCAGSGRVRKEKSLAVTIPAGVEDGTRIRLTGEGEAGMRGGPPGDLYIFLSIAGHPFFKREGSDIHCRVPVAFTTAALGGSLEVPTIDGTKAKVTIPEGTQGGHQFRLRGKGMSVMRSASRGDMYIHVAVETPVNLTKKQKELLKEFEKSGGNGHHQPESESFFSRVKEFWEDLKE